MQKQHIIPANQSFTGKYIAILLPAHLMFDVYASFYRRICSYIGHVTCILLCIMYYGN